MMFSVAANTISQKSTGHHPAIRQITKKIIVYLIAGMLGLLGLLFVVAGGQGSAAVRIAIGTNQLIKTVVLVVVGWLRPSHHVHHTQLDLTGDVSLENMMCRHRGGNLGDQSVNIAAGAVFIDCEYCGVTYQLEEAPKW